MPECIVCKGYYETGQICGRCGSDNAPWDKWRATHVEEQEGIEGLLAFYAPHLYLPFFTTVLALAFGLMGVGGLWKGIVPAAQLLAVAVTVCGCLVAALAGYGARHEIREQELLNRVRQGYGALLGGVRLRAIVVPAFSLLLVLLAVYAMITSDMLWELAKWFLLDPAYLEQVERQEATSETTPEGERPEEADGLLKKIRQVTPFALMGMYVAFMISFTYSSSLQLALVYVQRMNEALPQPIFLQGDLLARVVRAQAERQLNREAGFVVQTTRTVDEGAGEAEGTMLGMFNRLLPAPGLPGRGEGQMALLRRRQEQTVESGNWNWEELERMKDGGIVMKASGRQYVQALGSPTGLDKQGGLRVVYTVVADPWGRITKIKRDAE
jgi:hypothetical protein